MYLSKFSTALAYLTVSAGSFDFSRGRRAVGSKRESWSTYGKCFWASPLEVVRGVKRIKAESAARPGWTYGVHPITKAWAAPA